MSGVRYSSKASSLRDSATCTRYRAYDLLDKDKDFRELDKEASEEKEIPDRRIPPMPCQPFRLLHDLHAGARADPVRARLDELEAEAAVLIPAEAFTPKSGPTVSRISLIS